MSMQIIRIHFLNKWNDGIKKKDENCAHQLNINLSTLHIKFIEGKTHKTRPNYICMDVISFCQFTLGEVIAVKGLAFRKYFCGVNQFEY